MIFRRSFLQSLAALAACASAEGEPSAVRGFERRIFDLVNEIREQNGVPPLEWSDRLWTQASEQSARKAILKFPGHADPERGDVAQRLATSGFVWSRCAENLFVEKGYDDPVNLAVVCWWYSAGHRENLLNPEFSQSAVGIAIDPDHRIYATQIFLASQMKSAQTQKSPADSVRRAREPKLLKKLFRRG